MENFSQNGKLKQRISKGNDNIEMHGRISKRVDRRIIFLGLLSPETLKQQKIKTMDAELLNSHELYVQNQLSMDNYIIWWTYLKTQYKFWLYYKACLGFRYNKIKGVCAVKKWRVTVSNIVK